MNSPTFPQKSLKFFATSPVPVRRSGQAFMVIGPVQPLTIAYKYRRLVLLVKLPEEVYDSQTKRVGEQRSFTTTVRRVLLTSLVLNTILKKLVAIAEASFSMQVVWIYLSLRRLHNISYLTYWNSLPNFAMSASSLISFRSRLLNYPCTQFCFVIWK